MNVDAAAMAERPVLDRLDVENCAILLDFDGTLVVQAPIRPDAASRHGNGSRREPTGSRVIKGEVRLDAIRHQIRGAILTITLSKTEGPIF
ncbi:MAG: hypothetical protein J0H62_02460, partial [Rhizobiales bacterium]|nr:hypothetical protein [Hyphomicrobiales bacterium]